MWLMISIAIIGFYVMVGGVIYAIVRGRQRRYELQAEVQTRMIDKFSEAPQFVEFLRTDSGRAFVATFEEAPRTMVRTRILTGITRSIILTMFGLGLLAINLTEARDEGFWIAGFIILAIGVGYFVATFASFKLSRAWGLLSTSTAPQETSR